MWNNGQYVTMVSPQQRSLLALVSVVMFAAACLYNVVHFMHLAEAGERAVERFMAIPAISGQPWESSADRLAREQEECNLPAILCGPHITEANMNPQNLMPRRVTVSDRYLTAAASNTNYAPATTRVTYSRMSGSSYATGLR